MHGKTNDWAQWTNEFDALQQLHKNCSSTFHGMMFLFIHTKIFSHFISKIGVNDWKYTICPSHDTNNSTSHCKSQYLRNKRGNLQRNDILFWKLAMLTVNLYSKKPVLVLKATWVSLVPADYHKDMLALNNDIKNKLSKFFWSLTAALPGIHWPYWVGH